MKKRLEFSTGLVHRPKILFLDEPTLGLDVQTRTSIWEHIRKLKSETNMTIFLTTHYLEEADGLCDRIAIIDHGKIIALDTPDGLKKAVGGDVIEIEVAECGIDVLELIKTIPRVSLLEGKCTGTKARIKVPESNAALPLILETFWNRKIPVLNVSVKKPSLDQAFLEYTGRELRDEDKSNGGKQAAAVARKSRFRRKEGLIDGRRLTQAEAARLFGVTQPRISDLVRGKIDRFSIDTLVAMLGHAGVRIQIVVGRKSKVA